MAQQGSTRKRQGGPGAPASADLIPDKLYFRIGEVARLCGVPAYVLRFWESEFPQLKPNKGGTGQRLYRRRDVEMALKVKGLLYDEGYTIAGARQAFKSGALSRPAAAASTENDARPPASTSSVHDAAAVAVNRPYDSQPLLAIQKELRDLHALLSKPAVQRSTVQPIRAPRPAAVVAPASLPPPTPFARPRLVSSPKAPQKPAEPPPPGLFDDLFSSE